MNIIDPTVISKLIKSTIQTDWFINIIIGFSILIISFTTSNFIKNRIFKFLKSVAKQTKTKLDDIILESLEIPLVNTIKLIGIYLSISYLIISFNIGNNLFSLINALFFTVLILIIISLTTKLISLFLEIYFKEIAKNAKTKLNESIIDFIKLVIKITIYIIGFMIILSLWGININPLLTSFGIAGLAVSLAMKDILENVFSGIVIMIDGGIKVGDRIKINNYDGYVYKIGLRSTKIKLFDNNIVTIPNKELANSEIVNYELPTSEYKVSFDVGISYNSNIEKAKEIIKKIIENEVPSLDKDKPISVYITEMRDYFINLKVMYHIHSWGDTFKTRDYVLKRILEEFDKNNIDIPYPIYNVNIYEKK